MKHDFLRRLGALALAFALTLSLAPTAWANPGDPVITIKVEPDVVSLGKNESYSRNNLRVYKYEDGQNRQQLAESDYELIPRKIDGVIALLPDNIQAYGKEGSDEIVVRLKANPSVQTTLTVYVGDQHVTTGPTLKVTAPGAIVTNSTDSSIEILLAPGSTITLVGNVTGDDTTGAPVDYRIISGSSVHLGDYDISNFWNREITADRQGTTVIRASLMIDNKVAKTFDITVNVRDFEMRVTREDTNETIAYKKGTDEVSETVDLTQGKTLAVYAAVYIGTDRDEAVTWTSSNDDIVRVTGGTNGKAVLTAGTNSSGQARITVTGHGVSASFYVNVPKPGEADVQSVTLNRDEIRLGLDETFTLIATVLPSNADQKVRWESSPAGIVRVEDGKITPLKIGEATVTVTSTYNTTKKATCKVIVAPGLTSLRIKDANANDQLILKDSMSKPGSTQSIEAIALPNNAYFNNVTWSSSTPSVITVQKDSRYESGLIATLTSVGPGEAKITVKSGDVEGSCSVVIPGIILKCDTVTITGGKMTLKEGQTVPLAYDSFGQAKTETGSRSPEWISSNSAVVEVDRLTGMITARSKGTATIELMLGNYSAKCEVTVVEDTTGLITVTDQVNAGSPVNMSTARARSDTSSGTLSSVFNAVCQAATGGSLSYITNLAVASTEQGILHDEHHSSDDTGAGVGAQDRYYFNANTSRGQRPLSDLSFVPRTTFNGTAEVTFTGYSTANKTFSGIVRFEVGGTGDVMYSSNEGSAVHFVADDFNLYHPNLRSVSFTLPQESVGTLYYNYTSPSNPGTKVTSGRAYSRTGEPSLSKVTFVPAAGYEGSAKIAYKGTDTSDRAISGVVTITVTNNKGGSSAPGDVSYSVRDDSWVLFRPSDFHAACLRVLGESLSYVRFALPPSSEGTLFYNYRGFADYDSDVASTTSYYHSGTPSLGGVCFVPTTTTPDQVDIQYTGYSVRGNTFTGTIHIGLNEPAPEQQPLHYTVFTGKTVSLSASDLNAACEAATGRSLSSVIFSRLPAVSQGNLRYTRGGSSTPYNVTTGTRFYRTGSSGQALISNVYFQAAANYTGTVTIPFTGYSENGTSFTDEVVILVTPPTASQTSYSGTTASPFRLSSSQIASACSGALNKGLSYITFTTLPDPSAGKLYLGYSGFGTGTQVYTGTRYYASSSPSIDQISFVPRGRYSGRVTVGYTATDAGGTSVSGQLVFHISSTGSSSYFSDMGYHTWAAPSVDYLYQNRVTNGVTQTTFGPNQRINRCDFVLMLCRAFQFTGSNGYSFADVPTNSYFSQAVATAKQLGIINGDGGNFRPYGQVTRQDAMVMTYNALRAAGWNLGNASPSVLDQFSDSASVSSYARTAVSALVQMGAVNGDNGRLLPHNSITRAEAAVILHFVMTT